MIMQEEIRYSKLAKFIESVGKENIISILPAEYAPADDKTYPYFNKGDNFFTSFVKTYLVIYEE